MEGGALSVGLMCGSMRRNGISSTIQGRGALYDIWSMRAFAVWNWRGASGRDAIPTSAICLTP